MRTDSILKALDIDTDRYPVLSVVGGGGKTSLIFRMMEELTAAGEAAEGEYPMEVDFTGFCTGICVLSNVVMAKAFVPEARVCVIENACACVTPQTHRTAIAAMGPIQVDVI